MEKIETSPTTGQVVTSRVQLLTSVDMSASESDAGPSRPIVQPAVSAVAYNTGDMLAVAYEDNFHVGEVVSMGVRLYDVWVYVRTCPRVEIGTRMCVWV